MLDATVSALRDVAPGDYFRRKPDAKKTYVRGAYDRATRTYACVDCDDVGREIWLKGDTIVYVGFTY